MDIVITRDNAAEYLQESSSLQWQLSVRRYFIAAFIVLAIGMFFLVIGITKGYNSSSETYHYNTKENTVTQTITSYNYHITFGLGIAIILLFFYFLYFRWIRKRSYFKSLRKLSERHKEPNNTFTIRVNEQGVFFQDFELTFEGKWSVYSEYKIVREYLFLYRRENLGLAIPIKQMPSTELTELMKLVKSRLLEKRK